MNQPRPESSVPPFATAEHFLACVDVMVDWSALEPLLKLASAGAAKPLTLPALKIALLKQWYGIVESEAPFAVLDRLSFRSFVGYHDDGTPHDAAIVQELHQATGSRHPAMEELIGIVQAQLRELGYTVRPGQLREPSIAPCTETGARAVEAAGATSLFRPGELGRMVEAVTAKSRSQGQAPLAQQEHPAAEPEKSAASEYHEHPVAQRHEHVAQRHDQPVAQRHEQPTVQRHEQPAVQRHEQPAVQRHEQPAVQRHEQPAVQRHEQPGAARQEPSAAERQALRAEARPRVREGEAVRAVLEWPWGQSTELSAHVNIGRDYAFSPVAHELTPYTHVSRRHAELMVYGDGVWVRDLGSRNGTFVNNEEVPKGQAYLIDADAIIRFGPLLAVSVKLVD